MADLATLAKRITLQWSRPQLRTETSEFHRRSRCPCVASMEPSSVEDGNVYNSASVTASPLPLQWSRPQLRTETDTQATALYAEGNRFNGAVLS